MFGKFFFFVSYAPALELWPGAWRFCHFSQQQGRILVFFLSFSRRGVLPVSHFLLSFFFFTLKDGSHCCFLSHVDVHKTCACRQMLS